MNNLINIPFHSKPLCLIDADGKPYVVAPMEETA